MKLSEAIRFGAMLHPRSDCYLDFDGTRVVACCAAGGAALATGYPGYQVLGVVDFLRKQWPWIERKVQHPVRPTFDPVENIMNSLNDSSHFNWTRERIADWVATIEPGDISDALTVPVVEAAAVTR